MTEGHGGKLFWAGVAVGAGVVAYGVIGLIDNTRTARLPSVAAFLLGAGIAHDFVWAPAAVALGALTLRLPASTRAPVRVGLALTALLLLFTWPELHGYAGHARNPSALPLDYSRNVAATLIVLWIGVAAVVAAGRGRHRGNP